MDDFPIKLANRIFRDPLKAGGVIQFLNPSPDSSAVNLLPDSLAFDFPLPEPSDLCGAISRGGLADYLFVLTSPTTAAEIATLYLNSLRNLGWVYCPKENERTPLGLIYAGNWGHHPLRFTTQKYSLEIRFQPEPARTTFFIRIERIWSNYPLNATPFPVLLIPTDTQIVDKQVGGDNFHMHGIYQLQSPRTLHELGEYFTRQLRPLTYFEDDDSASEQLICKLGDIDTPQESWRLFFSLATTGDNQFVIILRLDSFEGITRLCPSKTADDSLLSVNVVNSLLDALYPAQPEELLSLDKLQYLPIAMPQTAQVIGSLKAADQWRIFLDMPGDAHSISTTLVKFLNEQGWKGPQLPNSFDNIGFDDSGFFPLIPACFIHSEHQSQLRCWTRPAQPGWIDVEFSISSETDLSSFVPPKAERLPYPTLKLSAPPNSVVYSGDARYHPQRFHSSVYIQSLLSQHDLMAHYAMRMRALGWLPMTQKETPQVHIGQWLTEAEGERWHCLLWIINDESRVDSYSTHLQIHRL